MSKPRPINGTTLGPIYITWHVSPFNCVISRKKTNNNRKVRTSWLSLYVALFNQKKFQLLKENIL